MKMRISKRQKKECLLIISSFLIGCFLTILCTRAFVNPKRTKIVEKTSLSTSIDKIKDAVVTIETYDGDAIATEGSGFIYKKGSKAYILTNEHILSGNKIRVINSDEEVAEGKLLGKDPYVDLAVIEMDKKYAKQVATLGDSSETKIGDVIFTAGSPISKRYAGTITTGILSGRERMVQTTVEEEEASEWVMKVLQFDASINPGNSGGPLLNVNGEVIGITTMKLIKEDIEGMAFATPIEYAKKYLSDLEKGKEIERPELGISMTDVTNTAQIASEEIELPNLTKGVIVLGVKEKSSASGKLQKGDVIEYIDDIEIKDISYVKYALFEHKPGEKIKVKIIRNKKEKELEITLKKS